MRKQILRFPVGRQFKEILEDDHEWYVVTDMHLNSLIMERGEEHHIPYNLIKKTYQTLEKRLKKTNPGKTLAVYGLHTHPAYPSGAVLKVPSVDDISFFIEEHYHNKGVYVQVKGHGIITKQGILLVKLPDNRQKLDKLDKLDKNDENIYSKYVHTYHDYHNKDPSFRNKLIGNSGGSGTFRRNQYVMADSQERAFKRLVHETPEIKTKMVRRTHITNMRRRR